MNMLEKFEQFSIENQEIITGGKHQPGDPDCFNTQGN